MELQSVDLESECFQHLQISRSSSGSALQSQKEQHGNCIAFYLTDERRDSGKIVMLKTILEVHLFHEKMKCWCCSECRSGYERSLGTPRVAVDGSGVQYPAPALAAGGRSRSCSGFILETRAVLGLHPRAFGLPAATVLSPASPAAVFSIRRVIGYYKLRPLPWCWRIPFFQHSSRVLQDEGLPAPFFRMLRLPLLWRQVRSRAGMRHGPSF